MAKASTIFGIISAILLFSVTIGLYFTYGNIAIIICGITGTTLMVAGASLVRISGIPILCMHISGFIMSLVTVIIMWAIYYEYSFVFALIPVFIIISSCAAISVILKAAYSLK